MKVFYYSEQYQMLLIDTERYRYTYLFVSHPWKKKIEFMIKTGHEGMAWQALHKFQLDLREELIYREEAGQMNFAFLDEV